MRYTFALFGNPNCGKTTMFNALTGRRQYVGNWPGVTVEKKEGLARKVHGNEIQVVDLPGIYSLSCFTPEEEVARKYLIETPPDIIINVLDATCLERGLYLTTQIIELDVPVLVVLNMMDEVERQGENIDISLLSERLGVPIALASAREGKGVFEAAHMALHMAQTRLKHLPMHIYSRDVERVMHHAEILLPEGMPNARFMATRILEEDSYMLEMLHNHAYSGEAHAHMETGNAHAAHDHNPAFSRPGGVSKADFANEQEHAEYHRDISVVLGMRDELLRRRGKDAVTLLSEERYQFIALLLEGVFQKCPEQKHSLTEKIDRVLTHRILALPIFLLVMALIFELTFGRYTGGWVKAQFEQALEAFTGWVDAGFALLGVAPWLHALVVRGVLGGVGGVLAFLPQIVLLFFLLSILEDSGYMARIAFVMDKPLSKIGLNGRSVISMIMGFGCTVPAIMSARTLESEHERRMTILLVPFMSCGARMPVYTLFAGVFFFQGGSMVIFSLYLLGVLVAIVAGMVLKKLARAGEEVHFVLEMPPYRFPTLRNAALRMLDKAEDFLKRAGTVIFISSIVVWFLVSFDTRLTLTDDASKSLLAAVGAFLAPVFAPLGFGSWQASVALLAGIAAKEAVISTLAVLLPASLSAALGTLFTPLSAYAFLVFVLLYTPCVAALAVAKRELGWKWLLNTLLLQTGTAWIVSFLFYQGGRILGL